MAAVIICSYPILGVIWKLSTSNWLWIEKLNSTCVRQLLPQIPDIDMDGLQYGILPGHILNNMLFKMERDYNDVVYDDSST